MAMNKDGVLALCTRKATEIELPSDMGGGSVFIRNITAGERDHYESSLLDNQGRARNLKDFRARFLVLALANQDGSRMFKDNEVSELSKMDAQIATWIHDEAQRINGIGVDGEAEAEKN